MNEFQFDDSKEQTQRRADSKPVANEMHINSNVHQMHMCVLIAFKCNINYDMYSALTVRTIIRVHHFQSGRRSYVANDGQKRHRKNAHLLETSTPICYNLHFAHINA